MSRSVLLEIGRAKVIEVDRPSELPKVQLTGETIRFAGGADNLKRVVAASDRVGWIEVDGEVVAIAGLFVHRMRPLFWLATTEAARRHMVALVRTLCIMKRRYPLADFSVQNRKLVEIVERWASRSSEDYSAGVAV